MAKAKGKATFVGPMLLLSSTALPEGEEWQYEIKLDGYRAIAFKSRRQGVGQNIAPKLVGYCAQIKKSAQPRALTQLTIITRECFYEGGARP